MELDENYFKKELDLIDKEIAILTQQLFKAQGHKERLLMIKEGEKGASSRPT